MPGATAVAAARTPAGGDAPSATGVKNMGDDLDKFVVGRFASTGARDTAIPAPVAGQLCMVGSGTAVVLQKYNGTAWVANHAASAWSNLTLASGYTTSTVTPQVRKEGPMVRAGGRITGTMTGTVTVATIPAGFRPVALASPTGWDYYGFDIPCGTSRARCRVYADGSVVIDNMTSTGTQVIDLSSLSWPVE